MRELKTIKEARRVLSPLAIACAVLLLQQGETVIVEDEKAGEQYVMHPPKEAKDVLL
jgi:hypothetical protein